MTGHPAMALPIGVITLTDQEQTEINGGEVSSGLALLGWALGFTVVGVTLVVIAALVGGAVYAASN